jgi:hypothetical protein
MNKQFDDLLYRAGLTAQGCWDELGTYEQEAIERLMKLIVQECADVLLKWKGEPFPFDEDLAASLIKEHFGVGS